MNSYVYEKRIMVKSPRPHSIPLFISTSDRVKMKSKPMQTADNLTQRYIYTGRYFLSYNFIYNVIS